MNKGLLKPNNNPKYQLKIFRTQNYILCCPLIFSHFKWASICQSEKSNSSNNNSKNEKISRIKYKMMIKKNSSCSHQLQQDSRVYTVEVKGMEEWRKRRRLKEGNNYKIKVQIQMQFHYSPISLSFCHCVK